MKELKRYKEELAVIGLLSLVLLAIRWVSATIWPTTGQYDLAAQTETVFFVVLRLVIYSLAAWMGLRVVAPRAYMHLKHELLDGFDKLPVRDKDSVALRFYAFLFFGLIGLALAGAPTQPPLSVARTCVVDAAMSDVGVREATGRNDGPEVERYLAHVGLGKGYAWCAAFVSYHLDGCGVKNPKSAWSPAFASAADRVWQPRKAARSPLPGDVFSIYYANLKRVGHVGLVTGMDGRYILTVEGNTSGPGSREGDGVYARKRELAKVYAVTSYASKDTPGHLGHAHTRSIRDGRMQAKAAAYAHRDERPAHRAPGGRFAARYHAHRAIGTSAGQRALASAWSRVAHHDSTLGQSMELGECGQRADRPFRGLRHAGLHGYAIRPMDQGAHVQGGYRYPRRNDHRGSARDTQMGMVGTGVRIRRTASPALAGASKVHPLTTQRFINEQATSRRRVGGIRHLS